MIKLITRDFPSEWGSLTLYCLNDIHYGDPACNVDKLKQFIKMIQDDPYSFVVCAGDLINNGLKSSKTNSYEEVIPPSEQKYQMIELLRPIQDRILVMVSGNHEYRSNRETSENPVKDMALALNVPYERDGAFLKIRLGKDSKGKLIPYILYVAHGASDRKVEDLIYALDGVDIILTGHSHKLKSGRISSLRVDPQNCTVKPVDKLIVTSSAWLNWGGYAQRGMYKPSPCGMPGVIKLSGKEKSFNSIV